ncbi:MAG: DUF368 domain-containing protein [Bacteroidota bacterium]|nr:DUF368 domain-containing protein [Bacteroidota bacterium]
MITVIKKYLNILLKGIGMGAANVIPGVSGGTIALLTGIFERLINAIKSFNLKAFKLFFTGKWKDFAEHTDFKFLVSVFVGIAIAILTLAKLLEYLFENYPVLVWAFFFGLILASVYFIGKRISKWSWQVIVIFILGVALAISISVLKPSKENDSVIYLLISGAVAACSMILPGLSGSFILLLMGNYQLVMIDSINNLDFKILIPVVVGAGVGLLAFSYILSWIFKKYKDQTLAILTGFILGSLSILWPWKQTIETYIDRHEVIKPLVQKNILPNAYAEITGESSYLFFAIVLMIVGFAVIWIMEKSAEKIIDE